MRMKDNMENAFEYISSIPKFAGKTELKNTVALIDELGIDTESMKVVHVAGTNGKGSVCSYISNVYVKAGRKTGLFISPHLIKMNERIQINNIPVCDALFNEAFDAVMAAKDRLIAAGGKHPAFFEFLFGMALYIFEKERVEVIVLETGLGGRLDSTNIIKKPIMTVITSVSRDHMAILGDTVEEIAAEKAGIIKKDVPVVFYGEDERVRKVIEKTASEVGAPYVAVGDDDCLDIQKLGNFIDFSIKNQYYDNVRFSVNSRALYQVSNAAVAATALAWLGESDDKLTKRVIIEGISSAFWEGRMEELVPDVIVDGAHNEDGIRAFLKTAKAMKDKRQVLMFSVVCDKDYEMMIEEICESGAFDEYVVCTVDYAGRALDAGIIVDTFRKFTDLPVHRVDSVKGAVDLSLKLKGDDSRLLIAGSLYLVGEVKELVNCR